MISDKAQELGRLIGQSSEYQALRRSEQDLRGDVDTQQKLEKHLARSPSRWTR